VLWTDDVPEAYRPEAFQALLEAELAKAGGFSVQSLDCSEFPCIATLAGAAGEDWQDRAKQLAGRVSDELGPDVATWMALLLADDDEGGQRGGVGLAFAPKDSLNDDEVRTRLDWRGQSMLKDLEHEIEPGAEPEAEPGAEPEAQNGQ
jgi:hypothetical protein